MLWVILMNETESDRLHLEPQNEKLVENVREAAVRHIGFVRINGKKRVCKPWWSEDTKEARNEGGKVAVKSV